MYYVRLPVAGGHIQVVSGPADSRTIYRVNIPDANMQIRKYQW